MHGSKWLIVSALLVLVLAFGATMMWLHQSERSLSFAKPWILRAVNIENAPYTISIGEVTVNWTNTTELGKLRIKNVAFAKRDGDVFAQFPEVLATVDPLGFFPKRRLLHRVILRKPRLFMTRDAAGEVAFGFNDSSSRMNMSELLAFLVSSETSTTTKPPVLPFRDFVIDDATLAFTDEASGTAIVSTAFDFLLRRRHGTYEALLSLPFTVDNQPVLVSANLTAVQKTRQHVLSVQMKQLPSKLICLFDTCPKDVEAEGVLDGEVAISIADADLSVHDFRANIATKKALFTAPDWFAEPLKISTADASIEGNWAKRYFALNNSTLQLEDTALTASGSAQQKEDGWYIKGNGESSKLDVGKLHKYWPLFMAPDSRTWVTNKLKSGYSAKATIALNFTPEDLAAEYFPEHSVDAIVDARDITFEYLPGFPHVRKMNGIAHFTATTLKIEGNGGTLLDGTKINHAILWCPELHSVSNPMEATLNLSAPARDAVTMLALKHFPFDDTFGLDAKTIKGTMDAAMKLKFNAFSDKPSSDPNEIHLEAVDYDINVTMHDLAQQKVYGGYNVSKLNGTLKASTDNLSLDGSLMVGDSGLSDITFKQPSGKPLTLTMKGRASKDPNTPSGSNDFTLTYASGTIPAITLRGKKLDAGVSYGSSENSLLADFPAMKLDIDLGELFLVNESPFTEVKGTLYCTEKRCESADISAKAGKADIHAGITMSGGRRQFLMTSGNAGDMLKALDITDRMSRGRFEMKGNFDDSKAPPHLDARLLITDFTLKNSKILGRIFSIGSLTGLANALTGSGIAFEKMSANIGSQGGLIMVDKGSANGASMGITFAGSVDTRSTNLNLKGVVAPAYAINSILGKLPIIGTIAGGEGGLIAFNYWVKGTYEDPDVGVNPLSGLTPGFLRGIFTGGDDKSFKQGDDKPKSSRPSGSSRP